MLRFFILLLFSSNLWASNLMIIESEFHNQSWYPLPKQEMHTAVVDSFISQVAQSHSFKLIPADDSRAGQAGKIQINIYLVEKVETVKVSVRWTSYEGVTHASSQSISLHGMFYEAIYDAFELVGRKSGIQITHQIAGKKSTESTGTENLEQIIKKSQGDIAAALRDIRAVQDSYTGLLELKVRHDTTPNLRETVSTEFDLVSKRQLDLAARLKREEEFEQAYATLRSLDSRPNLDHELKNAVREELYFALPIHQSDIELADIGSRAQAYYRDGSLWSRVNVIQSHLQGALKNNEQDINKSREINRRLDQIAVMNKYMRQSFRANAISQLSGVRLTIIEYYVHAGRYPEPAELQEQIEYLGLETKVEKIEDTGDKAIYTFTTRDGDDVRMHAHHDRVEIIF